MIHGLTRTKSVITGAVQFICRPKCRIYFLSLGIKAAYQAAKLQPNSSQLTSYFSSSVWWAIYFYTTTAELHPIAVTNENASSNLSAFGTSLFPENSDCAALSITEVEQSALFIPRGEP